MKSTVAAAILLSIATACSKGGVASGALPQLAAPHGKGSAVTFKTLASFDRIDGCYPYAGVVPWHGTLYGTTTCGARFGNGGIFGVTPSGRLKLIHSFTYDGRNVYQPMAIVGGTMYGAAAQGGKNGHGAVYSIDTNGKVRWVYSFKGAPDGDTPNQLLYVSGTLYGTTLSGGKITDCGYTYDGCGTVFKISPSGKESVIYRFVSRYEGYGPSGGLIEVNGKLYGTAQYGGVSNAGGIVFSVTPSGKERLLHEFGSGYDGASPQGNLVYANGLLYGTTVGGGANFRGTVFSVNTAGQEKVVYSFLSGSQSDGRSPQAGLVYLHGKLYGTTTLGGTGNCSGGCGTVFSVTPSGQELVLHSFGGTTDGSQPQSQLSALNSVLYGTTLHGGAYYNYGTVFAVTP